MIDLKTLTPAERARQLANPDGEIGIAIAISLNVGNKPLYDIVLPRLEMTSGCDVLEIGFGNGRFVPDLMRLADRIAYRGIDISATMVGEATQANAALVAAGVARFQLGSAEKIPFGDASFDRVFAIGVLHFWQDPAGQLAEIRRVLRPGGKSVMLVIDPRSAPDMAHARAEFGFHLKDGATLAALHRAAGFGNVSAETIESARNRPDGSSFLLYTCVVTARP